MSPLDELLAATFDPPAGDADPYDVIAEASRMVAARRAGLEALRDRAKEVESESRLAELRAREARWSAALARARRVLAERLGAALIARRSR